MAVPGTGAQLAATLRAADDHLRAVWGEWIVWDDQGRTGPFPRDFWDRVHQANAEREAIAARTWAYFDGPGATAEEHAAWVLMGCCRCPEPLGGGHG